jgi:hypothetical protein
MRIAFHNTIRITAFWAVILGGMSEKTGAEENVFFIYPRTTYMENIMVPGMWWANPALLAQIDNTTLFTSNVLPLENFYTISSIRCMIPVFPSVTTGLGIFGAGEYRFSSSSTRATEHGIEYRSTFTFTRPSFQAGIAADMHSLGQIGLLASLGTELYSVSITDERYYPTYSAGIGYYSPALLDVLHGSLSIFCTAHTREEWQWENTAKAGIIIVVPDSLVVSSLEYAFSLSPQAFSLFNPSPRGMYEVIKGAVSVRVMGIMGVMAGVSVDGGLDRLYNNGTIVHAGLELRRSETYNFYGGYEIGLSTDGRWTIPHRLWIAYSFGKKKMSAYRK